MTSSYDGRPARWTPSLVLDDMPGFSAPDAEVIKTPCDCACEPSVITHNIPAAIVLIGVQIYIFIFTHQPVAKAAQKSKTKT